MPCLDGRPEADAYDALAAERRLNIMAAQLCRAMEVLEDQGLLRSPKITSNMRDWWGDHKKRDRERREEERRERARRMRRKRALAKLTHAEKRDLGL